MNAHRIALPTVGEPLLAAATHPERLTPAAVWRLLSAPERSTGLLRALRDPNRPWLRDTLVQIVHERRGGFRVSTIKAWKDDALATACAALDLTQRGVIVAAVFALHFPERAPIQAAFYDALGIPHDHGQTDGDLRDPAAPAGQNRAAALRLLQQRPDTEAFYYLLALGVLWPATWPGLLDCLAGLALAEREHRRPTVPRTPSTPPGPAPEEPAAEPPAADEEPVAAAAVRLPPMVITSDVADLGPLDELLIQTIVQVRGGIQGAPDPERLDAILEEMTRLNSTRHQTFYHLGFRDALFGRPVPATLPAANPNRWRWYFAGFVVGLAREQRGAEIAVLYDAHEILRGLGDTGVGPSAHAAHRIFAALCAQGRYPQACGFVREAALHASDRLALGVLETATALLRDEQTAVATPMFDLLWRALGRRLADGEEVPAPLWADVRRRRAHCLRFNDDLQGARTLLESLLADSTDANRPAVLVDLALMDAGLRRLAELQLPERAEERLALASALERAAPRLAEAAALGERTRSHALYVQGFHQLLVQEYGRARARLEVALADFGQRPEVYRGGSLLDRARFHLGLALCLSVPARPDLERGVRLLLEGMALGLRMPTDLVPDLLLVMEASAPDLAAHLAEQLLERVGESVLEAVAQTDTARRSAVIADALVQRARGAGRSLTARTEDWLHVLPALQVQGRMPEATEALDALEEAGAHGLLVPNIEYVFADEREYGPAWTVDEAAWSLARLAESRGAHGEAAGYLKQVFYRAVSRGARGAAEDAREVLERIADYGPGGAVVLEELTAHYARHFGDTLEEVEEAPAPERPIHVLVVGGNETQARFDEQLRRELQQSHPHICVEFMHTGWGSNWAPYVADFDRRVASINAVVVSRYMRTMLGREIRRRCQVPWRGCGGTGRTAFRNSILGAVALARRE
ncbi:MAG: hypothetical protein IPL76_03440 [Gemmatimonadetes bacterium]|nr:hypothetical protein [Gemmatimonadota bacterium]